MRLLYFVQYFPPENASGLPLVMDMINGFSENGWIVDVYTPTPTRGVSSEVRKEFAKKRKEVFCNGKLTVHRMHLYREGKKFSQRAVRYCVFSLQCLIRGLFIRCDAVFSGGGPPTQGIVGGLIHKLTKKKFIFNPQDLFPDSLIVSGQCSEESRIVKIGRKMERFAYRNADAIITISDEMARCIKSRMTDPSKVKVVRNWIDTDCIRHISRQDNPLFDEFGIPKDKFCIVYAGNIGMVQGVETIVEAAAILREEDVYFVIFGNGSEENRIKELIDNKQIPNICIHPLQPVERVSEVYSLGDISVVSCKTGTGKMAMPSKIWSIMAAGVAIIGSFDREGELDKVLREADSGFCVGAEDAQALADSILELSKNPERVALMGENARQYALESLKKSEAVQKYIDIIEGTVK